MVTGRQGNGETGVAEMVCRTGTTQIGGIVVHLPSFRGCRAGLQGRYYTERPNHGVPVFISGLHKLQKMKTGATRIWTFM